jgi:hypothetical protein
MLMILPAAHQLLCLMPASGLMEPTSGFNLHVIRHSILRKGRHEYKSVNSRGIRIRFGSRSTRIYMPEG